MSNGSASDAKADSSELRYFDSGDSRASSAAIGFAMVLPLMAYAGVQVVTDSVALGLIAGAATIAWPIIQWRRSKNRPQATLRVDKGRLYVSGPAIGTPREVELRELLEVYLDTKTIQRLREAPSPIPDLRFLNQTVGGQQDESRIALELGDETLFLSEKRISHLEANEWFSKIRRFLRRHGWVPLDERKD
jgi:hypothetical protein